MKPRKVKKEMKQVHFDMDLIDYIKFEKKIYKSGLSVSEFFRDKAIEFMEGR